MEQLFFGPRLEVHSLKRSTSQAISYTFNGCIERHNPTSRLTSCLKQLSSRGKDLKQTFIGVNPLGILFILIIAFTNFLFLVSFSKFHFFFKKKLFRLEHMTQLGRLRPIGRPSMTCGQGSSHTRDPIL